MDIYKIDSHKLNYHISRLNDWLNGKIIYPIYIEVATAGGCNHRCIFCGVDFMGYQTRFLDTEIFKKRLSEMVGRERDGDGVKSIMYAGEGEPLLHKDIIQIVNHTKKSGIDVAFTTNGVLLKKKFIEEALQYITWIKVSINAATKQTYAKIHRTKPEDFDTVINNLSYAVEFKKSNGYNCTLGMQLILLPENVNDVLQLASIAKDIGIDYLVVKPYSQHLLSITNVYKNIKYEDYLYLADEVKKFNDEHFNVIFRMKTMKKWDEGLHPYKHCLALPFWAYIDAGGNVWACSCYLTDERFFLGNIYKNTIQEIMEGEKRKNCINWAKTQLDTTHCRLNCRMDEINRYLWEVIHPPEHVNFI